MRYKIGRHKAGKLGFVPLFLMLFVLVLLLQCSSYAAMKMTRDVKNPSGEQKAFLEKYRGIPAKGHLIENVPFYKQKDRNYCGPVVLSMVLNYWEGDETFSQEEIAKAIFNPEVEITNNSDMVFYPQSKGFLVYSFNGDIDKLKNFINEDIPVIVLQQVVDKVVKKGHYRVVIGYDESRKAIILHDPWLGSNLSMNVRTFSQLWNFGEIINKKNWALVILPEERAYIFDGFEENALTHHNIATALYNRGRLKEAVDEWEKAVEIAPEEVTFYYCIAQVYTEQGAYDKALKYGNLAVNLDNNNGFAYDVLGWAFYKKGMLAESLEYIGKAVQLNPDVEFIKEHYDVVAQAVNAQK